MMNGQPLSWRDVYKAVKDSEESILIEIRMGHKDHEDRLRVVEAYMDGLPTAERARLVTKLNNLDTAEETRVREAVVKAASRTFLLKIIGLAIALSSTIATIIGVALGHHP